MAYFWVQQWVALPVIVEEQMNEAMPGAGQTSSSAYQQQQQQHSSDGVNLPVSRPEALLQSSSGASNFSSGNGPFINQYSTIPPQQRMDNSRFPQQNYAAGGSATQAPSNFNMSAMAGALPDYASQANPTFQPQIQNQRQPSGASTPAVVYQMQQNLQFPHHSTPGYGSQGGYGSFAHPQYQVYGQVQNLQNAGYGPPLGQQRIGVSHQYPGYAPVSPQYYYYPGTVPGYGPSVFQNPNAQFQASVTNSGGASASGQPHEGEYRQDYILPSDEQSGIRRQSSSTSLSSVPRGPPRKPKQSGHALWVGNLPPGATVIDLKDHFSREATRDIESLFLISKSNCAFVNYRTEAACQAAMQRFHDSRFHGVRLVCRLRRSSTVSSGVPTAPAAMAGRRPSETSSPKSPQLDGPTPAENTEQPVEGAQEEPLPSASKVPEKFFVVKSLTLQDLEQSVRNGIWATQSHNEQVLNKAFEQADNVYLIFSANKSGEYFGYARMISPINEQASEIMRILPQSEPTETVDAPKTIPTPATDWAPKGRIIDDSSRGTIFWEAEISDTEEMDSSGPAGPVTDGDTDGSASQVWGKPFKIEWLSTNRLPFYRTRGLRNPWNANREVKIARDGTELETSVGKRLIQMFHRPGPVAPQHVPMMMGPGSMPQMGGPSLPF